MEIVELSTRLEGTDTEHYNKAADYWQSVTPTINGMLGEMMKWSPVTTCPANTQRRYWVLLKYVNYEISWPVPVLVSDDVKSKQASNHFMNKDFSPLQEGLPKSHRLISTAPPSSSNFSSNPRSLSGQREHWTAEQGLAELPNIFSASILIR